MPTCGSCHAAAIAVTVDRQSMRVLLVIRRDGLDAGGIGTADCDGSRTRFENGETGVA